ncbi:MAG: tetratricopeptide repeat protein [Candidatus Portnoybacteria bacterium]|nr:tetratricopeptide repeat protein [Candidatus Portnoybacteria bacterium]
MEKLLEGLIKIPLYLLVFLLPLFVLPFTTEMYEFPKLYLLFGLALLSGLGWLGKLILVKRALVYYRMPLDLAVAALLIGAGLATIFSKDLISSLLGFYGRFSGGFAELLLWIVFYLLITNNFTYRESKQLFSLVFASAFVLAVWFGLSFWGVMAKIPYLSLIPVTPLSISPQALAVFEALALVFLLLHFSLFSPARSKGIFLYAVAFLAYLSTLVFINFSAAWWIMLISLTLFLVWTLKEKILPETQVNNLSFVILALFVSLVFLTFPGLANFEVPGEILLNQSASWTVAFQALSASPFIGTGLGNYFGAYSLYRPFSFNQSPAWAIRFDTSLSQYANIIASMGIFGIGGFGIFAILAFYMFSKLLRHASSSEVKREGAFWAFGFLGVLISLLFYYQPLPLSLLFWLTLAPMAILAGHVFFMREHKYEFGLTPEASLFLTSLFFIGVFGIALVGYFGGRFYYADMLYRKALFAADADKQLALLGDAVEFNPFRIEYRVALASSSLSKVTQEVRKAGPQNIKDITPLAVLTAQAVSQAQEMVNLAPNSVVSWENRALVYRDLRGLVSGESERFSIEAFERAHQLEPANPVFPVQLARLYIDEGNAGKALEYNAGEIQKSVSALQTLTKLNPSHSNARYALGLAYERLGETVKARAEYRHVLELNPGNTEVKKRLESL